MAEQRIRITAADLKRPELAPFSESSEVQLRRCNEPAPDCFIAESLRVIGRALDAGYEALSLLIETLQYLLRRGVFELDDLLHNTLGTLLGALLWQGGAALASQIQRRRDP